MQVIVHRTESDRAAYGIRLDGERILMMSRGHVVLDRAGKEKRATSMDDILTMFNQISMECGN